MILSNRSIHRALEQSRLVIQPEPSPRQPGDGLECPYNTSSVDLTLADEISYIPNDTPLAVSVDLSRGGFASLFGPHAKRQTITRTQPFSLEPGHFVLGRTRERVSLPILDDGEPCLAARVEGRSSYARCGLLVHFTAPTIHSGFDGTITLELINMGPLPIVLRPDVPICQLIIEQVDGLPIRNDSQFQGQSDAGGNI
jgi:dCTP deaminase